MHWNVMDYRLEVDWVGSGYRAVLWHGYGFRLSDAPVLFVGSVHADRQAAFTEAYRWMDRRGA